MALHDDIDRWRANAMGAASKGGAAPEAMQAVDDRRDEELRVLAWRFDQLVACGYPPRAASLIARRRAIDLERARTLVTVRGCSPLVAARILL